MDIRKLINKYGREGTPEYRYGMVMYAKEHGVSETAVYFKTTRKTVTKWINAFKKRMA